MSATSRADEWVEEALERLSGAGYRRGGARREVLGLMSEQSCALSAVEIEDALAGHHHHLVCDHCGRLQPFSDEGLERAIERLSDRVPLAVSEHEVVLHGACDSCAD